MPLVNYIIQEWGEILIRENERDFLFAKMLINSYIDMLQASIVSSTLFFCLYDKKETLFVFRDWHQQLTFTIDVLHLWHLLCCQTLLYLLEISWWYTMSACLCLRKVEHKGPQTAQYQWLISGSTQSQNTMNIHRRCEVIKWNIQHVRDIQSVS